MNPSKDDTPEVDLIGYQLGLLDAPEAAQVESRLAQSPERRAEYDAVAEALAPLAMMAVEPAGRELVESVLRRLDRTPRLIGRRDRMADAADTSPAHGGPMVSLRELVGLAAAIALFVGVFVPGYQQSRLGAQRTACLENLRSIGAADSRYAAAFGGAFPFAGGIDRPWLKTDGAPELGAPQPGNSRHVYLLLASHEISDPKVFVCRGRAQDHAMPRELIDRMNDFPQARHVSYSTPVLRSALIDSKCDSSFPLGSDQNPQFEDRCYRPRRDLNSDSHGRAAGQNVVRVDGSAIWTDRTDVGPDGDNIMSLQNVLEYTGRELPLSTSDAMLVP